MDIGERKLRILRAIIDDYIATGIPVGSRTIAKKYLDWSSATIRNEMSDLEEMGLLEQPHTSAGRVPSDLAYRLYVDQLMQVPDLSAEEIRYMQQYVHFRLGEIEEVISQAANLLSEITNYTAVALTPQMKDSIVTGFQLVPITESLALVVLVTEAGVLKDQVISIPKQMDSDQIYEVSKLLAKQLCGHTLAEIEETLHQQMDENLAKALQGHKRLAGSLIEALDTYAVPNLSKELVLGGAGKILNHPEYSDIDKARQFLSVLETKDRLYQLLRRGSKLQFNITIGRENEFEDLRNCSVVTATYRIGDQNLGSIGVIGPTRMDYSRVMSVLGFMGRSLTEVLSNLTDGE